jgi:uncharacterized protein DUF1761
MSLSASIDYWAVFVAAIAGFFVGAVWYRIFATPWLAANGMTREAFIEARSPAPFIIAFISDLAMSFVLFGVAWHIDGGHFTIKAGLITAALCWVGFVITTMAVNNAFAQRKPVLLAVDGGYWLVVLALMGAIIGGMGPR